MTDIITKAAEIFCRTPLPGSVMVDQCARDPLANGRTGTNLLTIEEAKVMLEPVVEAVSRYICGHDHMLAMLAMLPKRCPFCGAESTATPPKFGQASWQVICDGCGQKGRDGYSIQEAVEYWNKRAGL